MNVALLLDDGSLDKPYAWQMAWVTLHWSGKHHRVVQGINLISLVWTDGDALLPRDFRLYYKLKGRQTKNEHAQAMLTEAPARGFAPQLVMFDAWYASLENLKAVDRYGWRWLPRLQSNGLVNPDRNGNVSVGSLEIPLEGRGVHLKGYGFVRVFGQLPQTVTRNTGAPASFR